MQSMYIVHTKAISRVIITLIQIIVLKLSYFFSMWEGLSEDKKRVGHIVGVEER